MKKIMIAAAVLVSVSFLCVQGVLSHDYCFESAGREYNISPILLYAIASVESNFNPKAININKNGSYDFGVMQINSSWYKKLGHERWMSLGDPCTNIKTGAMILRDCIDRNGLTWEAVGCYNASSKSKRSAYANKIYTELIKVQAHTTSHQQRGGNIK